MKKIFSKLLPFEKYEIETKLSKDNIIKRINSSKDIDYTKYHRKITKNGFKIAEKSIKVFFGGRSTNSFAPVANAKIYQKDSLTVISVTLRMNLPVCIFILPIYLLSFLCFITGLTVAIFGIASMFTNLSSIEIEILTLLFPLPIVQILFYFIFNRPAKRLKNSICFLLSKSIEL